jgi:hypothetical protein
VKFYPTFSLHPHLLNNSKCKENLTLRWSDMFYGPSWYLDPMSLSRPVSFHNSCRIQVKRIGMP